MMVYKNQAIVKLRSEKNHLDPDIPYHFLHEKEAGLYTDVETVNTLFLTGSECAFKCLMCDLWKNTLDKPAPPGAIARQITYALAKLPEADVIKLYNNGNFFDTTAITPGEYPAITNKLKGYKRVIVENHPKLYGQNAVAFNEMLNGKLEIAMGLETIHPEALPKLNKKMIPQDFKTAALFFNKHQIDVRAFVLLNPPYLTGVEENIAWTLKTAQFAFDCGAVRCSIIPVRPGNGVMDVLLKEKYYTKPTLAALEEVFKEALALHKGQVFVDTWDIGFLSDCPVCFSNRKERLETMNLSQQILPPIHCNCQTKYA